jgi:alpha-L-fucosidase 2
MLMQSGDGAIHLLPALPDVWMTGGNINGLKARGGFEIINMQWKDGKLVKAVIKSNLGSNLRLRVPNEMKFISGTSLKKAIGENKNSFYYVEEIPTPIISPKAMVTKPELKETFLYDIPTQPSQVYTIILK